MQNTIRKQFEEYLKLSGQKARYIAGKINLHEVTLSKWRRNRENLPDKNLIKITNYIMDNKGKFL